MRSALFAVVSAVLLSLTAPAVSSADFLSDVQDLASRNLTPAPLVPIAVPPSLEPLDRTLTSSPSRRRSGYALRVVHYGGDGPDAIIVLERDTLKTVSASLRDSSAGWASRRAARASAGTPATCSPATSGRRSGRSSGSRTGASTRSPRARRGRCR